MATDKALIRLYHRKLSGKIGRVSHELPVIFVASTTTWQQVGLKLSTHGRSSSQSSGEEASSRGHFRLASSFARVADRDEDTDRRQRQTCSDAADTLGLDYTRHSRCWMQCRLGSEAAFGHRDADSGACPSWGRKENAPAWGTGINPRSGSGGFWQACSRATQCEGDAGIALVSAE